MPRIDPLVTIESVLIPIHLIPDSVINDWREDFLKQVVEQAKTGLKGNVKMTVRDIVPSDLGLTNEVWYETTGATANQWEDSDIDSKAIEDKTWVCIWGVTDNSETPAVSAVRFDVGGAKLALWHLDKLNRLQHRTAIARSPIIIEPSLELTIEHYVKVANSGVDICFDGVVVEREGLTLRP